MITSFHDKNTEKIFNRERVRKLSIDIQRLAQKKLWIIHAAEALNDLKSPFGNRLEKLSGDRKGQYSIRINDHWRICFKWHNGNASDVAITDYH